jgi:hypothetical protein
MKIRTLLRLLLLLLLLLLPVIQGCALMVYPFARAFGSPSEGELQQCRVAFECLKAGRFTARIVAYPATDPVGMRKDEYPGTALLMAEQLRSKGRTNCTTAPAAPLVEPRPLGHNQLRYAWSRAHTLSQWVKTAQPKGDSHLFVEILSTHSGNIIGIQGYVVDASGHVAYERLLNSHQYGENPPKDTEAACQLILRLFLNCLDQPAERIFPPYGVG